MDLDVEPPSLPMLPFAEAGDCRETMAHSSLVDVGLEHDEVGCDIEEEGGTHAWLVVAACSFGQFLTASLMGWGIFLIVFLDQFGESVSETSLVGSICVGFTLGAGPVASTLCNLLTHRVTCILGSIIMTTGYVISAFAPNIFVLYFSYGFLIGSGGACLVVSSGVMASFYFQNKRQLVTGFVIAGCGVGGLVFPLIVNYLVLELTWRGAMLILGGISLQGCVAGALMRPKQTKPKRFSGHTEETKTTKKQKSKLENKFCDTSLLKNWIFLAFALIQSIRGVHSFIVFTTLPDRILSQGFTQSQGAHLLAFAGISSTIGRVLIGVFANYVPIKATTLLGIMCYLQAASILPLAFDLPSFGVLCVISAFYGAAYGMSMTLLPTATIELFGLDRTTVAYGYFVCGEGLGGFIGPPIAGVLYDVAGAYSASFLTASAIALLGGILSIPVYLAQRRRFHDIQLHGRSNMDPGSLAKQSIEP
ncbi:monocarboxylate transporter 14-like [Lineus longissimus]|uniref:monocarboxylate transporter 14-like n=1 Tax=Lineus longissimus TaxID=88925 RepID=UPI00315D2027